MTTIIETILENLTTLADKMNTMRSEHDGLGYSLTNLGKGHRELIDNLRAELSMRRDGETAMALGLSDRIGAVESGLRKQVGEEFRLQALLDSVNEVEKSIAVELLLSGSARTGPLEQIKGVVNLAKNERERVVRVIGNFRAPGFTSKSREQLLKLIQEAE